jgi:hypothetical protein
MDEIIIIGAFVLLVIAFTLTAPRIFNPSSSEYAVIGNSMAKTEGADFCNFENVVKCPNGTGLLSYICETNGVDRGYYYNESTGKIYTTDYDNYTILNAGCR